MKTTPLVKLAVAAIEDIKGLDVRLMDVHQLTTITDHMIVCTGTSNRHVKSIAESIIARAKEAGYRPLGVEGLDAAEWVLVDLGDLVVHVMQAQTRAFYQLEKLWDVPPPEPSAPVKVPRPAKPKTGGRGKPRAKTKSRKPGKAGGAAAKPRRR